MTKLMVFQKVIDVDRDTSTTNINGNVIKLKIETKQMQGHKNKVMTKTRYVRPRRESILIILSTAIYYYLQSITPEPSPEFTAWEENSSFKFMQSISTISHKFH